MRLNHKLLSLVFIFLIAGVFISRAQTNQSAIYDATALMNAKHGTNALLIPTNNGFTVVNPVTGQTDEANVNVNAVPASYLGNPAASHTTIIAILARNAGVAATDAAVQAAYQNNPFLRDILSVPAAAAHPEYARVQPPQVNARLAPPNAGAGAQTAFSNIANGVADFLIERAQQEIAISIFSKLQQFISRYPELDTLFPKTVALIQPVAAYDYNKTLQALKDAINQDLAQLIPRIALLYNIPRYQLLNQRVPAMTLVFSASTIISDLDKKSGVGAALFDVSQQSYLRISNNYASILQLVCALSNSLRAKQLSDIDNGDYPYIDLEYVQSVTNRDPTLTPQLAEYYLGLLYQQTDNISITVNGNTQRVSQLIGNLAGRAADALNAMLRASNDLGQADNILSGIKNQETQEATMFGKTNKKADRYATYANLIAKALSLCNLLTAPAAGGARTAFQQRIQEIQTYWPDFTNEVITMTQDFQQQQWSLGIQNLGKLLQTVSDYLDAVNNEKDQRKTLKNDLGTASAAAQTTLNPLITQYQTELDALNSILPAPVGQAAADVQARRQEVQKLLSALQSQQAQNTYAQKNESDMLFKLSKILQYVDLLVSISSAQNSQAVETLLESAALPAGSSRIKKVTAFNIAFNAYVGGFYRGTAKVTATSGGTSTPAVTGFANTYGFTAPIGFAISTGLGKTGEVGSASLLLGIFDVGSIIQYKLNNEGAYDQNINLAGLISPSVQLVYGFPFFLPLSIGGGCQWVSPGTSTSGKISLSAHGNLFLGVDIPIFNITAVKKKTH